MTRADETQQLWLDYRRTGDQEIRDRLILTYVPLVKYVAGRLASGLPDHADEGNVASWGVHGLDAAIEDYDPARDMTLEIYARARIMGQIIDELRSKGGGDSGEERRIIDELRLRDWGDSGEGSGGAGVREPRRPLPHAPSAEDAVDPAA